MPAPSLPPSAARMLRRAVSYPLRLGPYDGSLRTTPFLRLAVLHACSSAGDALVTVALAGSVFVSVSLDAARGRTALGLVCTVLPFIVVGPLLGPRIDRIRGGRRAVASVSCLGRAAACVAMVHVIHSLWLFPAAFASLVCSKTYLVAKASLVPGAVASDEDLVSANSRLAIGSSIVTSIAAVIGAGIYREIGSGALLYLDVVILLGGAVLAAGVRPGRPPAVGLRVAAVGPTAAVDGGHVAGGGDRPALPPGGLAAAGMAMASMRAMAGLMTALVIFAFRRDGAPLIWYGMVGVASVGGNLGGAAFAPSLRAHIREDRLVPACALAIGALALLMTQVAGMHRQPAALVVAFGVGFGASVAKLSFDALVQRQVPDIRRSRRFAQYETAFQLAWVLAALLPVLAPLSLGWGFAVVALCTLGGAVAFWVGVARAREGRLPSWWPDACDDAQWRDGRRAPVAGGADFAGVDRPVHQRPADLRRPGADDGWEAHLPATGEPTGCGAAVVEPAGGGWDAVAVPPAVGCEPADQLPPDARTAAARYEQTEGWAPRAGA